jgi:hypothetical protein
MSYKLGVNAIFVCFFDEEANKLERLFLASISFLI